MYVKDASIFLVLVIFYLGERGEVVSTKIICLFIGNYWYTAAMIIQDMEHQPVRYVISESSVHLKFFLVLEIFKKFKLIPVALKFLLNKF